MLLFGFFDKSTMSIIFDKKTNTFVVIQFARINAINLALGLARIWHKLARNIPGLARIWHKLTRKMLELARI